MYSDFVFSYHVFSQSLPTNSTPYSFISLFRKQNRQIKKEKQKKEERKRKKDKQKNKEKA